MKEILIIEDAESDAFLLERSLRSIGVTNPIHHALTAAEALLYLNAKEKKLADGEHGDADIIFFDLKLPDINGLDLLKLITERKNFRTSLKIVLSELGNMDVIKRAYSLGADSFIAKPHTPQELKELIRSFPDHWSLADLPQDTQGSSAVADSATRASEMTRASDLLVKNRVMVDELRRNIEALRAQVGDREEMLAIIESLTEELRSAREASQSDRYLRTGEGKKLSH